MSTSLVLDAGAGANIYEIAAILAYRSQSKLIVVDRGDDNALDNLRGFISRGNSKIERLLLSFGIVIPANTLDFARLELIIPQDYAEEAALSGQQASELFVLYPRIGDKEAAEDIANAIQYHLVDGGFFYIVTESANKFHEIRQILEQRGIAIQENCSRSPKLGGISGNLIASGNNCPKIPLYSIHGKDTTVYDMYGQK